MQAFCLKQLRPDRIIIGGLRVLPAVNFQYQRSFKAYKIGDVISERMLPTKFVTTYLFHA